MNQEVLDFAVTTFKNFEKDRNLSKKWVRLANILKDKFAIELSRKQIRDRVAYQLKLNEGMQIFTANFLFLQMKIPQISSKTALKPQRNSNNLKALVNSKVLKKIKKHKF